MKKKTIIGLIVACLLIVGIGTFAFVSFNKESVTISVKQVYKDENDENIAHIAVSNSMIDSANLIDVSSDEVIIESNPASIDLSIEREVSVNYIIYNTQGKEVANQTIQVEIQNVQDVYTQTENNVLVVANKKNPLPDGYEPSDLRVVNTLSSQDWYMKDEAASALEVMFEAASNDGVTLVACSGYRSQVYQEELYNSYVDMYGSDEADRISSRPGYSDHQTGLAMDIGDYDQATVFTQDMEDTPEGQWLYEHAHEYGFILRYPKNKDDITGYTFEPWHYRYIGVEDATKMYNISPDYTLEEYLNVDGGDYE